MKFTPAKRLDAIIDPVVENRLFRRILFQPNSGCWEWIGAHDQHDYGKMWFRGRVHRAHRIAYAIFVGTISEGMTVDHKCFNRRCCNPDHLRLMDHDKNCGRHECHHDWVERTDGEEEQCTAAICRLCGRYGCWCDWIRAIGGKPTGTQERYFHERGIPGNDHEIERRLEVKTVCTR